MQKALPPKTTGAAFGAHLRLAFVANRSCRELRRRPLRCCGAPRPAPSRLLSAPLSSSPLSLSPLRPAPAPLRSALSHRARTALPDRRRGKPAESPRAGGRRGAGVGPRPSHQPAPASCSRSTATLAAEGAARRSPFPCSAGGFVSSSRVPCRARRRDSRLSRASEGGPGRPGSNLGYCCQQQPNPSNCPSLLRVRWQRCQGACRVQAPSDIGGTPLRQDGKVWRWFEKGDCGWAPTCRFEEINRSLFLKQQVKKYGSALPFSWCVFSPRAGIRSRERRMSSSFAAPSFYDRQSCILPDFTAP